MVYNLDSVSDAWREAEYELALVMLWKKAKQFGERMGWDYTEIDSFLFAPRFIVGKRKIRSDKLPVPYSQENHINAVRLTDGSLKYIGIVSRPKKVKRNLRNISEKRIRY